MSNWSIYLRKLERGTKPKLLVLGFGPRRLSRPGTSFRVDDLSYTITRPLNFTRRRFSLNGVRVDVGDVGVATRCG